MVRSYLLANVGSAWHTRAQERTHVCAPRTIIKSCMVVGDSFVLSLGAWRPANVVDKNDTANSCEVSVLLRMYWAMAGPTSDDNRAAPSDVMIPSRIQNAT